MKREADGEKESHKEGEEEEGNCGERRGRKRESCKLGGRSVGGRNWITEGRRGRGDKREQKVRRDFSLPPALGGLARGGAEILLQSSTSYLSGGKSKGFFPSPLAGDNGRRGNFSSV